MVIYTEYYTNIIDFVNTGTAQIAVFNGQAVCFRSFAQNIGIEITFYLFVVDFQFIQYDCMFQVAVIGEFEIYFDAVCISSRFSGTSTLDFDVIDIGAGFVI